MVLRSIHFLIDLATFTHLSKSPIASPSHSFCTHAAYYDMKAATPLRLSALRPQRLTSSPSSVLLRRQAQPAVAGWHGRVRAMSTVVDYAGRPSQPPPPPPTGTHETVEKQRSDKAQRILRDAVSAAQPRHDWTKEEIAAIYYQPLMELTYQSVSIYPVFLIAMTPRPCPFDASQEPGFLPRWTPALDIGVAPDMACVEVCESAA